MISREQTKVTVKKITAIALLFFVSSGVHAACSDIAEPGVIWNNCNMEHSLNLAGKDLRNAVIRNSKMLLVRLKGADLRNANFEGSNLAYGNFTHADAQGLNLTDAVLYRADFTDADLRGAIFTRVELFSTVLKGADLTGAKWTDGKKICALGSIGVCR